MSVQIFNARRAAAADASGGDSADPAVEDEKPANKILVQTRRGRRDSTVDQVGKKNAKEVPTDGFDFSWWFWFWWVFFFFPALVLC